jgi:Flp pilus assembly protein TadD
MSSKAPPTAASAIALETAVAAAATPPRMASGALGEAGSRESLARLNEAMAELKALAIQPLLDRAVACLNAGRNQEGAEWALKALQKDERSGFGWYLLGIAFERGGDFSSSITAYETALRLLPNHADIANDLGRLAYRIGMKPQAEKLFRHFLARFPDNPEGANNLACVLRDDMRFEEAIELLKPAIVERPDVPMLWNTMGTIVAEQGDFATAEVFFREAIRLEPAFAKAIYNLGNSRLSQGDPEGALPLCEQALGLVTAEDERQMMRLSRSTILITLGRTGEGWDDYEARLHPAFADVTQFVVDRPAWAPGDDLAGKTLLVIGEQGLGDEVLFANVLPDIARALGPDGRLMIAVEPRLVPLFQRSFPNAVVGAHATYAKGGRTYRVMPFLDEAPAPDAWAPIASLLRQYRRELSDFPEQEGYLSPDPARVAYWREALAEAPAGPKVGLLWKSAVSNNARHRFFSSFDQWAPVLATRGVTFVNLQYGDCADELAQAERDFGVRIWSPPGIDLKQDLDDVAALCCAMDLVLGFSNATFNLAAGCGAPAWLITVPGAWPRLGTFRYPWYPQVRTFVTPSLGDWSEVMAETARALAEFAEKASER